jgi:thiamine transport system permease protein
LPVLRGIEPHLREAAQTLGASPLAVWLNVDLPIVARALAVGAVFALVISLGEFGATALIALPEFPTVPIAIYRLMGQPGISNFGQAIALGVILMGMSAVAILVMERVRLGEIGEF